MSVSRRRSTDLYARTRVCRSLRASLSDLTRRAAWARRPRARVCGGRRARSPQDSASSLAVSLTTSPSSRQSAANCERSSRFARTHQPEYRRRQAQHERSASSTRRSVATEQSSSNSTRAASYFEDVATAERGLRARARGDDLDERARRRRVGVGLLRRCTPSVANAPRPSRFTFQAWSERPSKPCDRAQSPALPPASSAARRHRRDSFSSAIFRPLATRHLRVAP